MKKKRKQIKQMASWTRISGNLFRPQPPHADLNLLLSHAEPAGNASIPCSPLRLSSVTAALPYRQLSTSPRLRLRNHCRLRGRISDLAELLPASTGLKCGPDACMSLNRVLYRDIFEIKVELDPMSPDWIEFTTVFELGSWTSSIRYMDGYHIYSMYKHPKQTSLGHPSNKYALWNRPTRSKKKNRLQPTTFHKTHVYFYLKTSHLGGNK